MIDAYEIGIQLALQDGVSAGLETISRELAEVDRAIAATTAGLQVLAATAGVVSHAAVSVRASSARAGDSQPAGPGEAGGETSALAAGTDAGAPVSVVTPRQEAAAGWVSRETPVVPAAKVFDRVAGAAARETVSPTETVQSPIAAAAEPAASPPASVPPPVSAVPEVIPSMPASKPDAFVSPVGVGLVPREGPTMPAQSMPPAAPVRAVGGAARASGRDRVVTASVSKVLAPPVSQVDHAQTSRPMRATVEAAPSPADDREVVAPWTGMPAAATLPQSMAGAGATAAPQGQAGDGGSGTTGTVMLDGRLVGYWLSEQMAREASRPPGGTTFFDPRQSPAWNASGAL